MHTKEDIINKTLEKTITTDTKIVVGVSGGPDSMYLLYKLKTFWKEKQYQESNLHVITCDHQTRPDTKKEAIQVCEFANPHPHTVAVYKGASKTEKSLRERRHQEFLKTCYQHKAKYLFLGHHLNDRIETSILNIIRGCGIVGTQSIQRMQKHYLDQDIYIIRPLINLTKSQIEESCHLYNIPYSIDISNSNPSVSKRNKVRSILESMKEKKNIEKSFMQLYKHLDKANTKETEKQEEIGILSSIKAGERNEDTIYNIYKQYHIDINPRSNTLSTLAQQLQRSGSKICYQGITIRAYSYGSVIENKKIT